MCSPAARPKRSSKPQWAAATLPPPLDHALWSCGMPPQPSGPTSTAAANMTPGLCSVAPDMK